MNDEDTILALAEAGRLQIVNMLRERPMSVNELASQLPVSQPQVSRHLRKLSQVGLVKTYPIAQQRFYGLDPDGMKKIYTWAETFLPLWDTKSEIAKRYLQAVRTKQAHVPTKAQPFHVEEQIAAPRQLVWEAWTVPLLLAQWFAPDYYSTPVCEMDVRPGGAMKIHFQAPDGMIFAMTGTFEEVVEAEKLRMIHRPVDENGKVMFELELTVRLTDEDAGTKVVVEAVALSTTTQAAVHLSGLQPGWVQNLANLNRMLTGNDRKEVGM